MIPDLHLYGARNYGATNQLPVTQLLHLARGRKRSVSLRERFNKLLCKLFGHELVLDRWVNARNAHWFDELDYEIHMGCRRCRFMQVLPPEFDCLHGRIRR